MIVAGQVRTDQQLVPEELGAQFNVSRTVVREALRVLESKGMITARPKTGTRVLPLSEWDLLDEDIVSWRVHSPDHAAQLHELLDLRDAIEPVAARRCAESGDPGQTRRLLGFCDEMATAIDGDDLAAFTDTDIAFHAALLNGSGNPIFAQISGAIEAALRAREDLSLLPDQVQPRAVHRHRNLALAIRSGDSDAAEHISRSLITVAREEITDHLASEPAHGAPS